MLINSLKSLKFYKYEVPTTNVFELKQNTKIHNIVIHC